MLGDTRRRASLVPGVDDAGALAGIQERLVLLIPAHAEMGMVRSAQDREDLAPPRTGAPGSFDLDPIAGLRAPERGATLTVAAGSGVFQGRRQISHPDRQ